MGFVQYVFNELLNPKEITTIIAKSLVAGVFQVVNELYGSSLHLCYKKAGASLAVIQQVAERTAEKTAKQVSHETYGSS